MYTRKDLKHGLEWISGKTKISVGYDFGSLRVSVYPDYPNERDEIRMELSNISSRSVGHIDLMGNSHGSGYQNLGYGQLVVNIGVQAVFAHYGLPLSDPAAKEITVRGTTSIFDDPTTDPEKTICQQRRSKFWTGRGFKLRDDANPRTPITARLSDLELVKGLAKNGLQMYVPLDEFWLAGDGPKLFESDVEALIETDLGTDRLESYPTENDYREARDTADRHQYLLKKTLQIGLSVIAICISFKYLTLGWATLYTIYGALASWFISFYFSPNISAYLPSVDKCNEVYEMLRRKNLSINEDIVSFEKSHNGFLWRIYQGVSVLDGRFSTEKYEEMAVSSRKLHVHGFNIEEYCQFIEDAKDVLSRKKGLEFTRHIPHLYYLT